MVVSHWYLLFSRMSFPMISTSLRRLAATGNTGTWNGVVRPETNDSGRIASEIPLRQQRSSERRSPATIYRILSYCIHLDRFQKVR